MQRYDCSPNFFEISQKFNLVSSGSNTRMMGSVYMISVISDYGPLRVNKENQMYLEPQRAGPIPGSVRESS